MIRPDWLPDSEYPFAIRELAIGGHRIRYVDEGSGPTLLFVDAGPAWSFFCRGHRPVGSSSPTVRDGFPERWMRIFPDARLATVEGGHHFPMNDAPDFVAATIRSWWNQAVVATRLRSLPGNGLMLTRHTPRP